MVEGGGELIPLHLKSLSSARQLGWSGEGMRDCLMVRGELWLGSGGIAIETGKHITGGEDETDGRGEGGGVEMR